MFDIAFTIKELAQISHTSTRTLRYYEELGLIKAGRSDNNYRVYEFNLMVRFYFMLSF